MRLCGWLAIFMVCMASACGGTGTGAAWPGDDSGSSWRVVQFTGAVLAARRPDGGPWHASAADHTGSLLGGLVGLAVGNPGLGSALGSALDRDGGDPLAPAPYVVLKIADANYAISPVGRTYTPAWPQPIAIDTRPLRGSDPVLIQIMDAIDGALLGQQALTVDALLSHSGLTLTNLGPVASLDIRILPAPARRHAEFDFVVPGDASVNALTTGQYPDWQAVPIWNGDVVTVIASGSVCPSRMSSDCFGPGGAEPGRWASYSYDDFKDVPHASLVGAAPGARIPIGPQARFAIAQSGFLLLFVNDRDTGNNSGAFQVHVTIDPPR
jgi:hypothetical protein